uniref:Uncharacterized protein n=1 Tax=Ditylenchus dipsaci TaxID=166011 RepID=A0A915D4A4_9BILA
MATDCIEVEDGMVSEVPPSLVNGTHNRQTATKSVEPITTQQATSIRLSNGSNDANGPRQMATKAASNISRALSAALRQCKDAEQPIQQEYDVVNLDESDEEELEERPCYTPRQQGDQSNALATALKQQSEVMTNMQRAIDRQNQVMATLNTTLMKLVEVLVPAARQPASGISPEPTLATPFNSLSEPSMKHKSPLPAIASDKEQQQDEEECQAKRLCLQKHLEYGGCGIVVMAVDLKQLAALSIFCLIALFLFICIF